MVFQLYTYYKYIQMYANNMLRVRLNMLLINHTFSLDLNEGILVCIILEELATTITAYINSSANIIIITISSLVRKFKTSQTLNPLRLSTN